MSKHPDHKYLIALLEKKEGVIEEIYSQYAGLVSSFVQRNSGTAADAKDIFQEALMDLFRRAADGFVLTRPFKPYFLAMCRYKWFDRLKAQQVQIEKEKIAVSAAHLAAEPLSEAMLLQLGQLQEKEQRYQLFIEKFKALSPHCQELIGLMWVKNEQTNKYHSLKEVASLLDRNYSYIRREKGDCVKKLMTAIQQDARYTNHASI